MNAMTRALALLSIALLACGSPKSGGLNAGDGLPAILSLADLSLAAMPVGLRAADGPTHTTTAVLTWVVTRDQRPLEVETCILWQECVDDTGATAWVLSELYRHPGFENRWRLNDVTDAVHTCQRVFPQRPTLDQVYAFLRGVWWTLQPEAPRRAGVAEDVVAFALCEGAWRRAIGALPQMPIPEGDQELPDQRGRRLGELGYIDD